MSPGISGSSADIWPSSPAFPWIPKTVTAKLWICRAWLLVWLVEPHTGFCLSTRSRKRFQQSLGAGYFVKSSAHLHIVEHDRYPRKQIQTLLSFLSHLLHCVQYQWNPEICDLPSSHPPIKTKRGDDPAFSLAQNASSSHRTSKACLARSSEDLMSAITVSVPWLSPAASEILAWLWQHLGLTWVWKQGQYKESSAHLGFAWTSKFFVWYIEMPEYM